MNTEQTSKNIFIYNLDNVSDKFDFKKVHEKEVKREIINLNSKRQHVTVLYQPKFLNNFATHIYQGTFPSELKLVEVTPVKNWIV